MRRLTRKYPGVMGMAAVVGCLSSFAMAQPTFTLESATVRPGETAQLGLFVSGGDASTSALNFTIDITQGQSSLGGNVTGAKDSAGDLAGFTYADNRPTSSQYRGVLYAPSSAVNPFSTSSSKRVATISVPVSAAAPDGTIELQLNNHFDADGVTGLIGLSNSAGVSIHGSETPESNALRGISVVNGTVTIQAFGQTIDFRPNSTIPDAWQFAQIIPSPDVSLRLTGANVQSSGFVVTLLAKDTFGFLQTKDTDATVIQSPGDGQILRHTWRISSNGAQGFDFPVIRLRASARDSSFTQEHIYQEPFSNNPAPVVVPTSGNPKVFDAVYFCPTTLTNDIPTAQSNGIILAMDVMQFDAALNGTAGTTAVAEVVQISGVNPAGLTNNGNVVNLSFANNAQGFTPIDFKPVPPNGLLVSDVTLSANGLTITPSGPPTPNPTVTTGINFSFGIWQKTLDQWLVASNTWYKVTFEMDSSATAGQLSHVIRMRFTVGGNDFTGTAVLNGLQDPNIDPKVTPKTYTAWLSFPPETVGLPVTVAYDVYKVDNVSAGTITLRNLSVDAYTAPAAVTLP